MDKEEESAKDVYAFFGLAMYKAQCFEMEVSNFLLIYERLDNKVITLEELENKEEKLMKQTLGCILKAFRKVVNLDEGAEDLIAKGLKTRNHLAHDYFKVNAREMMFHETRLKEIEYLQECCEIFDLAQLPVTAALKAASKALGLTDELINKEFQKLAKEMP